MNTANDNHEPDELDELIADSSEEELGVAMFTAKLQKLNEAGLDLGVTPHDLNMVLVAINHYYAHLVVPQTEARN